VKKLFFHIAAIGSILVFLHFRKMQMKKLHFLLSLLVLGISCDDGEVIVTNFDFEDQTLQQCSNFDFVFFTINSETDETLAFQFETNIPFSEQIGDEEITISTNSPVVYRRFNDAINADYFCSPIPPVGPTVEEEFVSTSGIARLVTRGIQDDNDGIPAELEGAVFNSDGTLDEEASQDSDGDGIVDAMDFDDDGDNVPTFLEGIVIDEVNNSIDITNSLDTDGDGILNYLDEDDDGDGILTRNEDLDGNLDPTNDRSDMNASDDDYLNSDIAINTEINEFREHNYVLRDIEVTVILTNLDFRNTAGEEVIRDITDIDIGSLTGFPTIEITITPEFNN